MPLAPGKEIKCPSCSTAVPIPDDLREAQHTLEVRSKTRRKLEPLYRRLGSPPSAVWTWLGAALVLSLPSCATTTALFVTADPGFIAAGMTFPALMPGAVIWLGAAAMRTTTLQMQLEMAAIPTENGHSCRSCGAPLWFGAGAVSASCGYCGADSVICDLPAARESRAEARALVKTVEQAMTTLRRRRALIVVGLAAVAVPVAATSIAIGLASWLVGG